MKCNSSMRRPLPSLLQLSRLAIQQCLSWWLASVPQSAKDVRHFPTARGAQAPLPPPAPSAPLTPSAPVTPLAPFEVPSFTLVDGTCGNGHDTLFLAETASPFLTAHPQTQVNLLAFDIQDTAVTATQERLNSHSFPQNLTLAYFNQGHEHAAKYCPPKAPPILAVYNLGFLPGSDKAVITTPDKSLASFEGLLPLMPPRAMFVIHAYGGHEGGHNEVEAVRHWAASLPEEHWTSRCYETITPVKNPESLFIIEKLR